MNDLQLHGLLGGGSSFPSPLDWSAYTPVYNWSGSTVSVPASSWHTFVNVTGEGFLKFVQAFSRSGNSVDPDVKITVDGTTLTFLGSLIGLTHGNLITQPIYFQKSLKIEVFNHNASAGETGCDYTILNKNTNPNINKQTLLLASSRNEAKNTTNSTSITDVINLTGSGYLLGFVTTGYAATSLGSNDILVTLTMDAVTKMNDRALFNTGSATNKQHIFNGPIRFENSLRVQHHRAGTGGFSMTRVFYTLD